VSALSDDTDIPDAQRQCPDFRDIIAYLEQGSLPDDDIATHKTVAESEHYTLLDDKLYHLHTSRQKQKSKLQSVTQQLCLPRTETLSKPTTTITHTFVQNTVGRECMQTYLSTFAAVSNANKPNNLHHKKAPLKSLPVEDVFARFHLDYLGPLPLSNGFRYLLVAIDSTSLYPEIYSTKSYDADEKAKVLYEQVFCRYDCPSSILTDRGSSFRCSLITAFCKLFKVKQIFTSSYHPQTNSRAENVNSIILKSPRIYCKDQSDWSQLIPAITWSYRASTTTSHGFSPFEVLFWY